MSKATKKTVRKSKNYKMLLWTFLIAGVGLLIFIGYFVFSYINSLPADKSAYQSATKGEKVNITNKGSYYAIESIQGTNTGLIFYPGSFVNPKAYIASYYTLAQSGINVYVIQSPLNFALINSDQAKIVIKEHPNITNWFVAGHSLGGVAACEFVKHDPGAVNGLILLGSYCNGDAKNLSVPVLSISASNDGLSTPQKISNSRQYLPNNTEFVEINGANHTQFGTFAKTQPGDNRPTISQAEAQAEITTVITEFINKNSD